MDAKTLALYLGCDVMHIDGNSKYNGKYQLLLIDLERNNGVMRSYEHNGVVFRFNHFHDKLLLRPLESMTDEEKLKLYQFGFTCNRKGLKIEEPQKWHCFKPEQFQWLCSEGFDLFGLIEKGEAIDANK